MKRILLVLFAFISLNAFSQLQVKEGSFKHILSGIIEDKEEYIDGNDFPMALIKISTENISEQERQRLVFSGNRETQILKEPKNGQMWVYLSAEAATFIDIKHPDYGTYKYFLPERLCDYCVYEMVLQYVNTTPEVKTGYLVIVSEPLEADVYIDGKYNGKTVKVISDIAVGSHEIEITKEDYYSVKKNVTIVAGETISINETLRPTKKEISISTDQSGDKIYIDGRYVGISPIKVNMSHGCHEVKAKRGAKKDVKTLNISVGGEDTYHFMPKRESYKEYMRNGLHYITLDNYGYGPVPGVTYGVKRGGLMERGWGAGYSISISPYLVMANLSYGIVEGGFGVDYNGNFLVNLGYICNLRRVTFKLDYMSTVNLSHSYASFGIGYNFKCKKDPWGNGFLQVVENILSVPLKFFQFVYTELKTM